MGANPIPMPRKKKGFVSRKQIEIDIKTHLQNLGLLNASSIARSTISDFKKYVINQNLNNLMLNANNKGSEQFRTQELGLWLSKKKGHLQNFSSINCPFDSPIIVTPCPETIAEIGQVVVITGSTKEELIEEMRTLTSLLVDCQKRLRETQQELELFKQRDKDIRNKKSVAGKKGGRGNQS